MEQTIHALLFVEDVLDYYLDAMNNVHEELMMFEEVSSGEENEEEEQESNENNEEEDEETVNEDEETDNDITLNEEMIDPIPNELAFIPFQEDKSVTIKEDLPHNAITNDHELDLEESTKKIQNPLKTNQDDNGEEDM